MEAGLARNPFSIPATKGLPVRTKTKTSQEDTNGRLFVAKGRRRDPVRAPRGSETTRPSIAQKQELLQRKCPSIRFRCDRDNDIRGRRTPMIIGCIKYRYEIKFTESAVAQSKTALTQPSSVSFEFETS